MQKFSKIHSIAMRTAHQVKIHFSNFSQALKAGWIIAKLFLGRQVHFSFAKATGEVREAQGIACGSLSTIEKGFVRFIEPVSDGKTQWRSFKIERLITWHK